jgi:nucleoside-diphosphate-sugar epimerase
MNVFLAGATGAIGTPLLKLLIARGHRLFAMTRKQDRCDDLWAHGAIPVVVDVFDTRRLGSALRAIEPDAIIHQLTDLPHGLEPSQMDEAVRRNARLRQVGTTNLVDAALSAGAERFVAQSIAWAYKPGGEPHAEDAALDVDAAGLRGISVAGVVALEHAVLATPGLRGCVLRYGHIHGPGTGSGDVGSEEISLHVEAAAWAAVLALEKGARGAFNVAEAGGPVSTRRIESELGWRASLRVRLLTPAPISTSNLTQKRGTTT